MVRRGSLLHTLLQREQLLRPERLVVDLRRRLNQILQVRPRQKVAQVHKLAVILVLHVHHSPAVLPSTHRLALNDHTPLRSNHCKRNNALQEKTKAQFTSKHPSSPTYPDRFIQLNFLFVAVVSVKRIQPNVVVNQFSPNLSLDQPRFSQTTTVLSYLLLERLPLLQRQGVRLGNNRNDVDNFAQLFHHNNVNRTQ